MKRTMALLLTALTLFALTACAGPAARPDEAETAAAAPETEKDEALPETEKTEEAAPPEDAAPPEKEPTPESEKEPEVGVEPEKTGEPEDEGEEAPAGDENAATEAGDENEPEDGDEAPPEEPEAGEPGAPVTLTEAQQYAANISLSNFSEQYVSRYDADNTSVAQLFGIAHLWAKINRRDAIEYENKDGFPYETLTLEAFYEILEPRVVFPEDLAPAEGDDYAAYFGMGRYDWDRCGFENGRFYSPAADGESYNRFAVADSAYLRDDGTWRFGFTVYEVDLSVYFKDGIPSEYYRLTPEEAANAAAAGAITAVQRGTALCEAVYRENLGREVYRIRYYDAGMIGEA